MSHSISTKNIKIVPHESIVATLGNILVDPNVVNKMKRPLTSTPNKVWFVAYKGHQVSGFSSILVNGDVGEMGNLFVFPEHQGAGVATDLFNFRLSYAKHTLRLKKLVVTSKKKYLGFVVTATRGSYFVQEQEL